VDTNGSAVRLHRRKQERTRPAQWTPTGPPSVYAAVSRSGLGRIALNLLSYTAVASSAEDLFIIRCVGVKPATRAEIPGGGSASERQLCRVDVETARRSEARRSVAVVT